ncbi:FAD-dependent monooxygenase [Hyphodiscus hymeniophilus]|uniref:FAD-dependent monooxygenase n=1 Tax=Hyphodiscus hymeniophilus TaxID=353542 RepID=A0A9P6VQ30_9HELO|nr:FAD-dependent monooxygenase [Hyphodiscus hymeniophilus]
MGYGLGIFERQRFLRLLHGQLRNKEKIHLKKRVMTIIDGQDSMLVKCADGSSYTGHIVVGTDGIHSRVRTEMQCLAPPDLVLKDKTSITAEYVSFFGTSKAIPGLKEGEGHTVFDLDHSSLLFVGSGHIPQWFFVTKLDKKYYGDEIPRFTREDMEKKALEYEDFQFCEGVTMSQLMSTTTQLSYVALEEANHEVWTHRRIVCLGDSIHKMTPNYGQGGNQAIEGAAVLTNCLRKMLDTGNGDVSLEKIEKTLLKYQRLRGKRAESFVKMSGIITRDEALATLKHTLRFLYFPLPSSEWMAGKSRTWLSKRSTLTGADFQTKMYSTAPVLDHLPIPPRLTAYKSWRTKPMKPEAAKPPRAQWVIPFL